jgi:hypothetical protein
MKTAPSGFGPESLLLRTGRMRPGRALTGSLCITRAACENWATRVVREVPLKQAVPAKMRSSSNVRQQSNARAVEGTWSYLARESATGGNGNAIGFSGDRSSIDLARELERWQSSGDPRLWKVILSPEFGERIDLGTADARLGRTPDS